MRFELDDEIGLLRQSIRDFLEKEASLERMRPVMEESAEGYPPALYRAMAELGYLGLWLPEAKGGAGLGALGLTVLLHEMGRVAGPGPLLELAVASELLAASDRADAWLAQLIEGDATLILADTEAGAADRSTPPACEFREGRVVGQKRFVAYGAHADAFLVTTRQGLVLVEREAPGLEITALRTVDHAQRFVDLSLASPGTLLLDAAGSERARDHAFRIGALGAAAILLGLMERALEITLDYIKEREAFGAPIASFQALQHRAADMLLQTESTRAATYRAAWAADHRAGAADHQDGESTMLIATAKAYAADAARFVCGQAIQLHGGVGFTWEYDPHIYYKRAKTLEQAYGSTRWQIERVLEARGL